MLKKSWGYLLAAALVAPAHALDKNKLVDNVRKSLNIDPRIEVKITEDPKPSPYAGLDLVSVDVGGAPYSVYVAKDEKSYIWGTAFDLTVDPDKERMSKIDLKTGHSKGSASAPVTLVEFSDLQCPFCSKAHESVKAELYKNYKPEQVRHVFKHFPLNIHEWAEPAAIAAECAAAQRPAAFWDAEDYFFSNQQSIKAENFKQKAEEMASQLKLDKAAFDKCQTQPGIADRIRKQKEEGQAAGVTSTPTFFVNGRMLRGFRDFDDLKVLIDAQLAEAKKK